MHIWILYICFESKVKKNINTQRKFTIQVGTCEAHSPRAERNPVKIVDAIIRGRSFRDTVKVGCPQSHPQLTDN